MKSHHLALSLAAAAGIIALWTASVIRIDADFGFSRKRVVRPFPIELTRSREHYIRHPGDAEAALSYARTCLQYARMGGVDSEWGSMNPADLDSRRRRLWLEAESAVKRSVFLTQTRKVDSDIELMLAEAYVEAGRTDEAWAALDRAVLGGAGPEAVGRVVADALYAEGRDEEARNVLRELGGILPAASAHAGDPDDFGSQVIRTAVFFSKVALPGGGVTLKMTGRWVVEDPLAFSAIAENAGMPVNDNARVALYLASRDTLRNAWRNGTVDSEQAEAAILEALDEQKRIARLGIRFVSVSLTSVHPRG